MTRCAECGGLGWLLNDSHAGAGPANAALPISLNLTACYYPDCDAPQVDGHPRPIATLGLGCMFTDTVRHPATGEIMAVSGYTKPDYR